MKKILILGSDLGSLDIAVEAKAMGLYVITSDLMETSPTKQASDEAWLISTTDIDALEKKCRDNEVSAVLYGVSDFNSNCARRLCKRLGLIYFGKSDYVWALSHNKAEFKKACLEVGAPVATGYHINDAMKEEDLKKIKFPVVVKPVDKSGNRGVSYCANEDELRAAYKYARELSDNEVIVCERQLHGPEWVVNYIIENGEARLLYFGRELHQHGFAANNYSMITTTSNGLRQWNEEVDGSIKELFKSMGFDNGVVWFETIRDDDGKFYLIEPGYRFSSESLYSLYGKVNRFNTTRWFIECALGIKHDPKEMPIQLNKYYPQCAGGYHLFACRSGKIAQIEGLDILEKMENVVIDLPKRVGGTVINKVCMGLIKIYGNTVEELVDTLKQINSVFFMRDEFGENMFIRYTDYQDILDDFVMGRESFDLGVNI